MATYCVTYTDDDNWGEARDRFKTRAAAVARVAEARAVRPLVRLVRWENNVPTQVLRETARAEGAAATRPASVAIAGRVDQPSVCPAEESDAKSVADALFRALREMDAGCSTGLCNYVSCSPYAGQKRKDEPAITWGITEALQKHWKVEQREHPYPTGGGRCDRVVELADGARLWLEVKLAWRTWFYEVVKYNAPFMYNGYFGGEHHSHSVAGDFAKLERIGSGNARYAALLLVGFDGADGTMAEDFSALSDRERLIERGWCLMSDTWVTRQNAECWNRCWFAWRQSK